ncbi:MAG TPA: OsmC family protein [Thermodesulfovibrionia bacterium]|nr:OsmC family protein [Thermodesulfovibrionia bacterium]
MDITISFPGGKRVDAEFSGYRITTDQPVKDGGEGTAPSPFLYFLASVGTCVGYYILSFCQNRGLSTDGIKLVQRHEYVKMPDGKMRFDKIVIDVLVPPDFPEKYHDALVKVAEQCAVKKAIFDPPSFEVHTKSLL